MAHSLSVAQFAKEVVRVEMARGGGANDAHLAEYMVARLRSGLVTLIGTTGFDVMLARSLVLARRDEARLAGVTAGPDGTLVDIGDVAAREEVAIAILSHFLELLVALIGEDIAMRLVRDVWPAAAKEETK